MTLDEYNEFCRTLPATTYVVQWGGSHVWKVGGKVFAIGGLEDLITERLQPVSECFLDVGVVVGDQDGCVWVGHVLVPR